MKEQVITLGESRNLVGILCDPAPDDVDVELPTILLFNAGMVHRVGPFRLNTLLARKLAEAGYSSLRFDLAGIGDSELESTGLTQDEQMLFDVGLVIEYLQESKQVDKVVMIGLCTGADNVHKAAAAYTNVVGAIFLDGYSFPTTRFVYNRLKPVLSDPARLARAVYNRLGKLKSRILKKFFGVSGDRVDEPDNLFVWELPPKLETKQELLKLVERKVALCYIYTSGSYYTYNYENQFRESFKEIDFASLLTEHYFPQMDHTYILSQDRDELMHCINDWLDKTCSSSRA